MSDYRYNPYWFAWRRTQGTAGGAGQQRFMVLVQTQSAHHQHPSLKDLSNDQAPISLGYPDTVYPEDVGLPADYACMIW